jgi:hypothetical protein
VWALYSVHNKITKPCILNRFTNTEQYDQRPPSQQM